MLEKDKLKTFDEIKDGLLLLLARVQVGGVVEDDPVVLREIVRGKHRVVIRQIDLECTGRLRDRLQLRRPGRDRRRG